jgi:polysaccharide export outer membrane protein
MGTFSFLRRISGIFVLCSSLNPLIWAQQPTQPAEERPRAYTTESGFPEYRIGVGDELRVRIWNGIEAKEYEVTVQTDGSIFLPFIGLADLKVDGLSSLQLRNAIVERLGVSYRQPAAEVVITKRIARVATLLGEIRTTQRASSGPGRYSLPGRIQLLDFITEHGGMTDKADLNNTQLIRHGETQICNLSKAIFEGDNSQNPIVDEGDLVFVPPLSLSSRKFFVFGEVTSQGLLELPSEAPIAEIIAEAGGFTRDAHKSHVVIVRGDLENPQVLAANFEAMKKGDISQNIMAADGDLIFVGRRKLATYTDVMNAFAQPLNILVTTAVLANSISN